MAEIVTISLIYQKYDFWKQLWDAEVARIEDLGLLVFHNRIVEHDQRDESQSPEFWSFSHASQYIQGGNHTADGLTLLLKDFDLADEMLVMIIDHSLDRTAHSVSVYKLSRLHLS